MTAQAPGPPAVLLGGEATALSVARSLGKAGIPVHVLGDAAWDTVRYSRCCTHFTDVGSGEGVQQRWLDWLRRHPGGGVVLPCTDEGLELVARNRALLADLGYATIEANDDVVLAMLDKGQTYALARQLGVPAPRTATIRTLDELTDGADIGFPCAIKPVHSHVSRRRFGLRKKAWPVRDRRELEDVVRRLLAVGLEVLVTEIIPGDDDEYVSYYGYLDERGESLLHLTKRKLRQYPPGFGLGTYHATRWDAETADLGLRYFRGVGVRGLANVEFKRDARDGQLKLIECNHRFTAATELVRLAGIDLALFTYNRLVGRPGPRVDSFREEVYLWLPLEDARAFALYRDRGDLSISAWLRSVLHRQHFPVWRLDDPLPALVGYTRLLRRAAERVRATAPRPAAGA